MRVLAIDTALDACAAAVLDTGRGGIIAHETLALTRGHAEALMPLVARVMDAASIAFAGLDRLAVTTGPGSFTGLRVGISACRAIALATASRLSGSPRLPALRRRSSPRMTARMLLRQSMRATITSISRFLAPGGAPWLRRASPPCATRREQRSQGQHA